MREQFSVNDTFISAEDTQVIELSPEQYENLSSEELIGVAQDLYRFYRSQLLDYTPPVSKRRRFSDFIEDPYAGADESNLDPTTNPLEAHIVLNKTLEDLYNAQYEAAKTLELKPPELDYLFQQYGIYRDMQLGRVGFNHFATYITSYADSLSSAAFQGRESVEDHAPPITAVLVGCSSATTAMGFFDCVSFINVSAKRHVLDIDQTAVELAATAIEDPILERVSAGNGLNLPFEDGSVDFLATNFLIKQLRDPADPSKSQDELIRDFFFEINRVLSRDGSLVMIERLTPKEALYIARIADSVGLNFGAPGYDSLTGTQVPGLIRPVTPELYYNARRELSKHSDDLVLSLETGQDAGLPSDNLNVTTVPNVINLTFVKKRF